jgi:hypothetical protein
MYKLIFFSIAICIMTISCQEYNNKLITDNYYIISCINSGIADCFHISYFINDTENNTDTNYGIVKNAVRSIYFDEKNIYLECYGTIYPSQISSDFQYYIVNICKKCTYNADSYVSPPMGKKEFDIKIKEMGIEKVEFIKVRDFIDNH